MALHKQSSHHGISHTRISWHRCRTIHDWNPLLQTSMSYMTDIPSCKWCWYHSYPKYLKCVGLQWWIKLSIPQTSPLTGWGISWKIYHMCFPPLCPFSLCLLILLLPLQSCQCMLLKIIRHLKHSPLDESTSNVIIIGTQVLIETGLLVIHICAVHLT